MEDKTTVVAVDIAKTVFEIAVSETPGAVGRRPRLRRAAFLAFFKEMPKVMVVMEACGSAHYWARQLEALGHNVRLLPPHQVRPYVTRNKTDRTDAKGILEAFRNQDIYPVPVKSVPQQALCAIHRFRSGWLAARTAQVNTVRGLLREFGFIIPEGIEKVLPAVHLLIEDADAAIPDELRLTLAVACDHVEALGRQIKGADRQLEALAENIPQIQRIFSIPGIGLITATALFAFVGDVARFPSARHFASYLGLTPRERSSGNRRNLGGISKRGDRYLRTLLIHGARSVLVHAAKAKSHDRLRSWAMKLKNRTKYNKAAVGLANRLARIVWAIWKHDRPYASQLAA